MPLLLLGRMSEPVLRLAREFAIEDQPRETVVAGEVLQTGGQRSLTISATEGLGKVLAMVHYEYVGRLSEQTLLCISVVEAEGDGMWNVLAQLLIVASDKRRAGRIELACASYADPLEAVTEGVALSRALQQTAEDRAQPVAEAKRVRRPLG